MTHQHLKEALRGRPFLLVWVAALEKMRLLEEVSPLAMQANCRQSIPANQHLGKPRPGLPLRFKLLAQSLPLGTVLQSLELILMAFEPALEFRLRLLGGSWIQGHFCSNGSGERRQQPIVVSRRNRIVFV